jgi:hypothetical protein
MRKLHGNPWAVLVVVPLGFFMTCESPEEKL